ncbi:RCCD1 isoform 8, partial [Pan troglodytes]
EERPGAWFGFGFCGFGQELGSGRGRQVHSPSPLRAGVDICRVSASWSYTAFVTRMDSWAMGPWRQSWSHGCWRRCRA